MTGRVFTVMLNAATGVCVTIYLAILFLPNADDLLQMRRILLTGVIVCLAGATCLCVCVRFRRLSCRTFWRDTGMLRALAVPLAALLVIAATFQKRLPDAFRHAYASAFVTFYAGEDVAARLGDLVEWLTSYKKDALFNTGMDDCNNRSDREIALRMSKTGGTWRQTEKAVRHAYASGDLILSKDRHDAIRACHEMFFPAKRERLAKMRRIAHRRAPEAGS